MFPLSPPGACTSATTQEILAAKAGTVGEKVSDNFAYNSDFHINLWFLHAANLRHGTDGFTSPPKEGVLRIFSPQKSEGFGRVSTDIPGY